MICDELMLAGMYACALQLLRQETIRRIMAVMLQAALIDVRIRAHKPRVRPLLPLSIPASPPFLFSLVHPSISPPSLPSFHADLQHGIKLDETLAERFPLIGALAHQREGALRLAQHAHAVMNSSWPQPSLADLEPTPCAYG